MAQNKIISKDYILDPIYNEQTKICLRNQNRLKLTAGGLESKPIIDVTVPEGREWLVHFHIEIHEKPEIKP